MSSERMYSEKELHEVVREVLQISHDYRAWTAEKLSAQSGRYRSLKDISFLEDILHLAENPT